MGKRSRQPLFLISNFLIKRNLFSYSNNFYKFFAKITHCATAGTIAARTHTRTYAHN